MNLFERFNWTFVPLLIMFTLALACARGQDVPADSKDVQAPIARNGDGAGTFTLHVTAREVVLDVIARDKAYHPVGNLQQSDFAVYEIAGSTQERQRPIVAFQAVDPALVRPVAPAASGGFHVALSGGCAADITVHYRLSFQPSSEGWRGGNHEILVTTTRPGVMLTFRHTYYVGQSEETSSLGKQTEEQALRSLQRAACYHSDIPASMGLKGRLIEATPQGMKRYSLVIQPDSLAFSTIADEQHRVTLDYGACVFDREGNAVQFMHHSTAKVLSQQDYAKVETDGFANRIDLPLQRDATTVRFVVRDRATGNLGVMEMGAGEDGKGVQAKGVQQDKPHAEPAYKMVKGRAIFGTVATGSFGSIVPQAQAQCGDVYELKQGTPQIITNFGVQDAVGRVYTPTLEVQKQALNGGLPGVTPNEEWFSIDYYGEFWTTVAGEYHFRLMSDDGANLYIDDRLVISQDGIHPSIQGERSIKLDVGRHTIHVPYFQGPNVVSLVLEVKAPGKPMEVFDMRKFGPPPAIR